MGVQQGVLLPLILAHPGSSWLTPAGLDSPAPAFPDGFDFPARFHLLTLGFTFSDFSRFSQFNRGICAFYGTEKRYGRKRVVSACARTRQEVRNVNKVCQKYPQVTLREG